VGVSKGNPKKNRLLIGICGSTLNLMGGLRYLFFNSRAPVLVFSMTHLRGKLAMKGDELKAKFVGAMVGSALGDAIGELAFWYPQEETLCARVEQVHELRYTDDTAMAIGLAESLVEKRGVDPQHLGETFSDNFAREPWRGYAPGPPCIFSMVRQSGITYSDAAKTLFEGKGSLGNGAAMRISPLGLFYHDSPDLYEQACASSRVTHGHPVGMDGAAVQAFAVAQAVTLDPHEEFRSGEFIRALIEFARTPEIQEKMKGISELIAQDVPPDKAAPRLGRTVAVHESMPFAIYSFLRNPESFEECLFTATLHGGDRDTLGAMAGAISGAYLGVDAIPELWRSKLENRTYIEDLACSLKTRI
jgi:poly(ADP-ribose) glycohydrolase ARH3